jgi:hypothetical protein
MGTMAMTSGYRQYRAEFKREQVERVMRGEITAADRKHADHDAAVQSRIERHLGGLSSHAPARRSGRGRSQLGGRGARSVRAAGAGHCVRLSQPVSHEPGSTTPSPRGLDTR